MSALMKKKLEIQLNSWPHILSFFTVDLLFPKILHLHLLSCQELDKHPVSVNMKLETAVC